MNAQPHVLQRHALHQLHDQLTERGRGVVVMPCGSGKTLLGRWFAEQLAARVTVVFVPSLALVPQTVLAYREGAAWAHTAMIVCSDPTSGRAVRLDDIGLPVWARESVTSSTSPRAIAEHLAGPGPKLIVSTYHSAPKVATGLATARVSVDLMVCDEAHRLTGRPRAEFRAVLDDKTMPATRRVFLTATPVEAAAWGAELDVDDVDAPLALDDEALFGPTVYRATFADAVAAGRLVDYDVEVLAVAGDPDSDDQAGAMEAVLAAAREGATRIFTFHSRVRSARDLASALDGHQLPDGRVVGAEHVEARHRAERRVATLGRLTDPGPGRVAVVASARTLTEGVDVPAVDTVVFAEPRTSAVDIVQAVGRAMRLAPGKTRGRVVLAVTTGGAGVDEDTELAGTAWRHVWTVLRALASMDPRFATRLRTLQQGNQSDNRYREGHTPELSLTPPDGVDWDRWMLRALDRTGASWWASYDLLAAHARQYGAARPSSQARRGGIALGSWVARQRTLHKQGALEPERVEALQQLPGWAWSAREVAWWTAAKVWTRHGGGEHVDPGERWTWLADTPGWPQDGSTPSPRRYATLAAFAVETCARRRRGELPGHLERAAGDLPGWSWTLIPEQDTAMVDALREYAEWEKDLNPTHDQVDDETGLPVGAWLTAVRRRRYTGRLHPALELELDQLARPDWWTPLRWERSETGWRLSYLALRQFVDREHTTRTPTDHHEALPDCEINISRWSIVQRLEHRLGRLAADRVATLEQIPGWRWEIAVRADQADRLVRDDVEHGARGAYVRGCRCDPCCDANTAYARALNAGEIEQDLVDADRARAHLNALFARGALQKPLARAAGVNVKSIVAIAEGEVSRIRAEREQLILALTVEDSAEHTGAGRWGETVPAGPTWKLIDWMVMRGWPKSWISREIGQDGRALQLKRDQISKVNADKVAELDRRLGRTRRPPARTVRTALPTLDGILAAEQQAS